MFPACACACMHACICICICKRAIILEFLRGEGQKFKATALSHAGGPHCSRAATWSCPIWRPHGTARTIHIPLWPVTYADLHPGVPFPGPPQLLSGDGWSVSASGEMACRHFCSSGASALTQFLLLRGDLLWRIFAPPGKYPFCLLYTSPSPRDQRGSRMPSSA